MSNPLANVIETEILYAYRVLYTDGVPKQRPTKKHKISAKRLLTNPERLNLETDVINRANYLVWVLSGLTVVELEAVVGFGDADGNLKYLIINRDQSPLKAINSVFGVRCICQKLD